MQETTIAPNSPLQLEKKSFFDAFLEGMVRDIPAEEWQKLPTDGAENHDHYLYGAPKKNERAEPMDKAA